MPTLQNLLEWGVVTPPQQSVPRPGLYDEGGAENYSPEEWERAQAFFGNAAMLGAEFAPVTGEFMDAAYTANAVEQGDWLGTGVGLAALGLPFVGARFMGGMADDVVRAADDARGGGIRAYHGSPHDFDEFDASHIGTGEGAQAYGHGLYFAESEGVARSYRDQLAALSEGIPERALDDPILGPKLVEAEGRAARLSNQLQRAESGSEIAALLDDAQRAQDEFGALLREAKAKYPGRVYEVNINANPEEFLDADQSWIDQPEIMRALVPEGGEVKRIGAGRVKLPDGAVLEPEEVASRLQQGGIPGIRYLDQGSRSAGEGTSNYVVFPGNENLIEILKKYGILAPTAGLGIGAATYGQQPSGGGAY